MTSRKFFFLLRRINAVLIFIAGLLGSVALGAVIFLLYGEATRERHVADVLNVSDEQVANSRTSLEDFKAIAGSPVLRAALKVEQEYALSSGSAFSSGSKDSYSTQNYLFFDPGSGSSYWLIPGFKGIIRSTTLLPGDDYAEHPAPVKLIVYELIERDSNRDGQLTASDLAEIAISDPAGTRLTRVLKDVEGFNSAHLLSGETEAVVFYTSAGSARAARIDVVTGKVVSDTPLKPLKESSQRTADRE